MFTANARHFPVVGADGEVIGVVTDTDLIGVGRHTPFALRSSIQRAKSPEEAVAAARALPTAVLDLMSSGAAPLAIGRIIALVIDALTGQLLHLAIEELGEPPAAWAWLALGSAARQEQSLRTDQDHAMTWGRKRVSRQGGRILLSSRGEGRLRARGLRDSSMHWQRDGHQSRVQATTSRGCREIPRLDRGTIVRSFRGVLRRL